jgi:transposase
MGLVDRDDGWRMPDWLWERVEPLLPDPPEHPLGTHRRGLPKRQVMDAILLVLRTGMQWNALTVTGVCNSSTAHRRFQEWERAGVFHEIWRQGLLDYDAQVGIDWSWLAAESFFAQIGAAVSAVRFPIVRDLRHASGWTCHRTIE